MDLQGDMGQMEVRIGPFGDSVNLHASYVHSCTEHAIGLKIVLGTPNGTPR
jgi:hypothetical protein